MVVCAVAGLASADTPQQQADKLFAEGRELLTVKNDAKGACEKFEAAIQLDPTATGTMLNLGLCYETLGKTAKSLYWFRKAQAAAAEARLAEYKEAAEKHTTDLAPKVPWIRLQVTPPEAEIRIDGQRIDPTEYGKTEVDPGDHEIVARAPGKQNVVQHISMKEATNETVTISVTNDAVPVYVDKGKGRRRGGVILMAAGGAALVFTGVYGIYKRKQFDDVDMPTMAGDDKIKDELNVVAIPTFIVGVAAVTTGAILYFTAPRRERISDGTAFAPLISNDQIGVAAFGSF
jgi:hypothetical protein